MILIAIDPGSNGAIAVLKNSIIEFYKMPKIAEFSSVIKKIATSEAKIYIESVSMRPQDISTDGVPDKVKIGRAFKMQELFNQYNKMLGILYALEFEVVEVQPRSWQSGLKVYKKKEDYKDRKDRLAGIAKKIFEPLKVAKYQADAALILRYAMKIENMEDKLIVQQKLL